MSKKSLLVAAAVTAALQVVGLVIVIARRSRSEAPAVSATVPRVEELSTAELSTAELSTAGVSTAAPSSDTAADT
ncbi:MAG: hypothetical protein QM673_09015 [Gordonia sp. (in: high G+C Gram-positive bacteria)]